MLDRIEIYARHSNDIRRYLNFANSKYLVYSRRYVNFNFFGIGTSKQCGRMPITYRMLMLDEIKIYARHFNDIRRYLNFANWNYHVYSGRYVNLIIFPEVLIYVSHSLSLLSVFLI